MQQFFIDTINQQTKYLLLTFNTLVLICNLEKYFNFIFSINKYKMKIITKINEMQTIADDIRCENKSIAIVPTMGFLHEGHAGLIRRANELADVVVTSLFVNPTQFAPNEDFERYPRNFEKDCKIAEECNSSFLFYPDISEMYPSDYNTMLQISKITNKFEGSFRPNHFNGVATIVAKLFNSTKPHIAIFGQKDYQQTLVIKQLVKDLNYNISIVISPTRRENDGLAMSSRNTYLKPEERMLANILFFTLEKAIHAIEKGERKRKIINAIMHNSLRTISSIMIDYASAADSDTLDEPEEFLPNQRIVLLIAVYLGKTRLIDNALVTIPSNISSNPIFFVEGI